MPKIKYLEGGEHGVIGNAALEPEEQRTEGEQDKGGPIEESHGAEDPDGQDKLEVVGRDESPLLLNLYPLPHRLRLGILGLHQLLQVDRLVGALHGVGHKVEQGGGEDQLQRVGECARGVHQHHVAGGQGGEALVEAVLVQSADLIITTVKN